jgi:hypothetical protein
MEDSVTSMLAGTRTGSQCTPVDEANTLFAELVKKVPGVLRVESSEGEAIGRPAFRVYVRPGAIDAEYEVYQVECDVYHRHPESRLDVVVLKQLDLPEKPHASSSTSR